MVDLKNLKVNILTNVNNPKFKAMAYGLKWIERNKDGKIISKHDSNPKIGFTLVMAPFTPSSTYITKPITEIIEKTDEFIHFKTEDNEYKLQTF